MNPNLLFIAFTVSLLTAIVSLWIFNVKRTWPWWALGLYALVFGAAWLGIWMGAEFL